MRLLDFCCGRWGWSRIFSERGWECVGVDLIEPPDVPERCIFQQENILSLNQSLFVLWHFDFAVASTPCDEFCKFGMPHIFPNPPYPELGIKLFNHTRQLFEASGLPYVMENVRAAQKFVGSAVHHCGPFYLWGTGVPPLLGQGISKGIGFPRDKVTGKRILTPYRKTGSKSIKKRAELKAQYATIPKELASVVAQYAERILE